MKGRCSLSEPGTVVTGLQTCQKAGVRLAFFVFLLNDVRIRAGFDEVDMNELKLTAIFEKAEEGGYIGYVAELPGANTQGETIEETRWNLKEAVSLLLECYRDEAQTRMSRSRVRGKRS